MISANLSAIFILSALRLIFSQTSRQGNLFGIFGMVIAVTVTFLSIVIFKWIYFVLMFILAGG